MVSSDPVAFVLLDFATFCDFAMYHHDINYIHIERFTLDDAWVQRNVHKFGNFFRTHMVRKLIDE